MMARPVAAKHRAEFFFVGLTLSTASTRNLVATKRIEDVGLSQNQHPQVCLTATSAQTGAGTA